VRPDVYERFHKIEHLLGEFMTLLDENGNDKINTF